jgi:uncharacterized BrkB/YihY/UPF0761 family membrane protein
MSFNELYIAYFIVGTMLTLISFRQYFDAPDDEVEKPSLFIATIFVIIFWPLFAIGQGIYLLYKRYTNSSDNLEKLI